MNDSRIIIEDYLEKEVINYFFITSSHECRVNMRKIGRNDGLELDELTVTLDDQFTKNPNPEGQTW
jgi:hypothetical protein